MLTPLENGCSTEWTWKEEDPKFYPSDITINGNTAIFHPMHYSQNTIAIRGSRPINDCTQYWELQVKPPIYGTSNMFGIGSSDVTTKTEIFDYVDLIGIDKEGWGLNHKGQLWHNGERRPYMDVLEPDDELNIGMLFKKEDGTLTYYINGENMGIAFRDLNLVNKKLYPMVSSTAAGITVKITISKRSHTSLMDRAREIILLTTSGKPERKSEIQKLELPKTLIQYIQSEMA